MFAFTSEIDKHKFEYIYEKYKRLLWLKAYEIVKDHALAEDAVSEAYMRAFKHIKKIGDPDLPQSVAYLVTIVRNVAIDIYNRQKRTTSIDIASYDEADDFNLEELIEHRDKATKLISLVDGLREELRAVFLLKYAYDMPHKAIANALGITENNVTVRLHRAKTKLIQWAKEADCE